MRNDNFSNDNLPILDPYQSILKKSAVAKGKKKIDISIMSF